MGESKGGHSSGNKYNGSRQNRSYGRRNSSGKSGYRGKPGGGYPRRRGNSGGGRGRFRGEKISHDRYISKAIEGYVAPSIYVEDKHYDQFNLTKVLQRNILNKGYIHPTKIQDQAIPVIMQGRDILGMAPTGSGKTGAFLIPLINNFVRDRTQKCLIIVPTRELAAQIQDEFRELSRDTNLYSTLIIGGMSMRAQTNQLRRGPQFVIGTPGRLKDLVERKELKLHDINNIILDEVDRMLDMGFIPDITFLIKQLRDVRQTLFFSATMTPEAEKIARTLLKDPVKVQAELEAPGKSVDQDIVKVKFNEDKTDVLAKMLYNEEFSKVLIFSRTKRGADKLSKKLEMKGFKSDSIHGDKSQNKRLNVLDRFKTNKIDYLVATDVAARGLDIPNVTHVINFDEPENYKDYIHRIGRTGRAGKKGSALTFVS